MSDSGTLGPVGDGDLIDLNSVWLTPARHNLAEIKRKLAETARDWLPRLFPDARPSIDGRTLRCADLSGRPPRKEGSCVLHLDGRFAGWGFDHATGESAGPIDMIHHGTGLTAHRLFDEAARLANVPVSSSSFDHTFRRTDHAHEVARILTSCQPISGSLSENYLRQRGLTDPGCEDLLFHNDLADFETRRGWPGFVARVRRADGSPTGGLHRTYLLDDGSAKAPAGKKMLGPVAGGSVHLSPIGPDGRIGLAEGIETALAARHLFDLPVWAALSADSLRNWQWPSPIRHVTIFADGGEAGQAAADGLADRLRAASISCDIIRPLYGDDFNDDLLRGATAQDYETQAKTIVLDKTAAQTPEHFIALAAQLTRPPDLQHLGSLLGQVVMARLEPLPERQVLAEIKRSTGIAMSILDRQTAELRRRLNASGDLQRRAHRPGWADQLRLDLSGTPERNEANVITALSNDPAFAGAIIFDEFRQEIQVARHLPWQDATIALPRPWSDSDDVRCAEWLQRHGINVAPSTVSRSVAAVARDSRIHPVRDYLDSLLWDGQERLANWTHRYLGAENTKLNRSFGALWMISAVARIFSPAAKVDHMLILEGPQGAKKSSALKTLASPEWFTDELAEIGSKDAAQQMRGVWIIEIAELDAISRAEVSRIKAFLTRTVDRYRPPYERYVVEVPRQCVFAGSVNPDTYLRDETGNRRFWPVRCGAIELDALARDRDQLWAEATARYRDGAIWWLDDPDLMAEASKEQEARYQADAWDGLIERWLSFEQTRVNHGYGSFDDWRLEEVERPALLQDVSVAEILRDAIGIEAFRWTRADQMRVTAYLKSNGWQKYQARSGGRNGAREWRYRRGAADSSV